MLRGLRKTLHSSQTICKSVTSREPIKRCKVLSLDSMNPHVRSIEYAVRGPIVIRAGEIEKELKEGAKKDFSAVVRANIGDCHAVGQEPLTFLRQVLAVCMFPKLFEDPSIPEDAKQRADRILSSCGGRSIGAYSDSAGIPVLKEDIAKYISERDGGIACDPDDVYACAGASEGIRNVMKLFMTTKDGDQRAGVMIPIPQYPLYTATLAEYNAYPISYFLNEEDKWSLTLEELRRSISEVKGQCKPRGIVIINPGNPTGQVLSKQNIQEIIQFAKEENLFIIADEVYQFNVYAEECEFHSFKKVIREMGSDYDDVEVASFMTVSKGFMGECGLRGGYGEVINLDPEVKAMFKKALSAKLCPSVVGQAAIDVVMNPPKPGEPSYELFAKQKETVLGQLAEKARMVSKTFNSIPGVSCNPLQGSMYAFPNITLPPKAIQAAKDKNLEPDVFYCFTLLEETGMCVVPGSGFGQKEGTYHFRTTILPPVDEVREMLIKFEKFHTAFTQRYS